MPVCFSCRCQLCEGGLQEKEEALRVNNGPIGVFDSGLGGLSVLQELKKVIPEEDYIFFGDSKNAPYGVRSDEEVYELSLHVFDELMKRGAKAVVVACNTATSVAVRKLRDERPDVPIVGMEPAVKPAVEENPGGRVVVMATPVTLRREKFAQLAGRFHDQAEIISLSSPEIVRYVENGRLHDERLRSYIRGLFDSLGEERSPDAVVLGCTHFPFVADLIREAAGSGVRLYDGNHGTAEELLRRLKERDLLAEAKKNPFGGNSQFGWKRTGGIVLEAFSISDSGIISLWMLQCSDRPVSKGTDPARNGVLKEAPFKIVSGATQDSVSVRFFPGRLLK